MDIDWNSILSNHFLWGLAVGLLVWFYTIIRLHFLHRSALKAKDLVINSLRSEKGKLRQHLQTQSEIEAESKEQQKQRIDAIKTENENLRTSVQTLKLKPRREEMILLQVYDHAIHLMQERAPGFAPTWENALKEAKLEIDKANKGIIPFVRRIIHPSSTPLITKDNKKMLDSSEN